MSSINRKDALPLPRKALCIALAAAFAAPAIAQDDEVARLTKPESNVSIGVGHVSGDNQLFGTYNGLAREGTYGIGNFSIIRRNDDTGTWFRAEGRNIGLPTAEARIEHERQGHWRYFLEVDQLKRYTPYEVHSGFQGVGSNNLAYPDSVGAQPRAQGTLPDFSTQRLGSKLGFSHNFSPELDFSVVFQNVEKKGERLFGRGTNAGGGTQEFLAEPINSITRQLDVILNYTGNKLQLSGGYYGSWYLNADNQLNVAGGDFNLRNSLANNPIPFSVFSLAPDNYAHQLHLSGGYQFTAKTRGNFKVAYSHAGQTDSFPTVPATNNSIATPAAGLNMSGRSDLGGRLDTTLVQLGVTSRPITNLSLLGNVRYENRDDKTALAKYIDVTANPSSTDGFNEPRSLKTVSGKLEANYLLPRGYRLTGAVENEQKNRSIAGVRVVGYREQTDETSYRLEVQRALSESLNGSIAYIHSERTGSAYGTLQTWNPGTQSFNVAINPYSNRVQPIYIAGRNRDKLRLFADWTPVDALTLQFAVEDARDSYGNGRDELDIGPRRGDARLYSLDATWTLNDKWRVNGWFSHSATHMSQASGNGTVNQPLYAAALFNYVDAIGLGMRGKITGRFDVGADAMVLTDLSQYRLSGNATSTLPDIKYDQTTLKFFGRYALNKDTTIRLDYVFDYRKANDWTWNGTGTADAAGQPYVYTDGTYLYQRPEDKVHFIGVSANYSFR